MAVNVNDVTSRFIEAFNARDWDAFEELFTEDTEFRRRGQPTLRGEDGARAILRAAEESRLMLRVRGEQQLDNGRVQVPVRVTAGRDVAVDGTAVFEIRDGMVAAFEVVTED